MREENRNRLFGIDLLRAISILSVLFFHLDKDAVPNGYLGVDIFFIVSGYLITSYILNKKKNLPEFFLNRFFRLFPSLVFFISFTLILTFLFQTPKNWNESDAIFSLLGVNNLNLYMNSVGYFNNDINNRLFGHTWSLGVEEQFYLLISLIFYYLRSFFSKIILILLSLSLLLVVINFTLLNDYQSFFYLTHFRFFQLGSGVILSLYAYKYTLENKRILSLILKILLFVILFSQIQFNQILLHLLVSLISILLILQYHNSKFSFTTFEKKISGIGKMSYSLYLYHWPIIIVISQFFVEKNISYFIITGFFIILFSCLNYFFIEKKRDFFYEKIKKKNFLFFIIFVALLSFIFFFPYLKKQINIDNSNLGIFKFIDIRKKFLPRSYDTWVNFAKKCHFRHNKKTNLITECLNKKNLNKSSIYLLGDSHALNLITLFMDIEQKYEKYETKFVHLNAFVKIIKGKKPNDFDYVLKNANKGDIIIINFYHGKFNKLDPKALKNLNLYFENFFQEMNNKNIEVIWFKDYPSFEFKERTDTCILQYYFFNKTKCEINKQDSLKKREASEKFINQIGKKYKFNTFDTFNILCPNEICRVINNNEVWFTDWNHISDKAADRLKDPFLEKFYFLFTDK